MSRATPAMRVAAELEAGRRLRSRDPDFFTTLGAATLPGIQAIARELAQSHAARGERRVRVQDPSPATCDEPS